MGALAGDDAEGVVPLVSPVDGGISSRGGAETLTLSTPLSMRSCAGGADARVELADGDELFFALQWSALGGAPSPPQTQDEIATEITGSTPTSPARTPNASPTVDISQLRAATRQRPRDPAAWVALGQAHDARGELVAAYRAYRKATNLAPEARRPQLLLASTLLRGGSADEALPIAQRLVRQQPDDGQAVLLLGLAQREENKPAARCGGTSNSNPTAASPTPSAPC